MGMYSHPILYVGCNSWWRHQMEIFSALLALCVWIHWSLLSVITTGNNVGQRRQGKPLPSENLGGSEPVLQRPVPWRDGICRPQWVQLCSSDYLCPCCAACIICCTGPCVILISYIGHRVILVILNMFNIDHRWIPLIKASDAELWYFLWSALEPTVE